MRAFSFLQIKEKFTSLSQREQLLVVLVLAAAGYFVMEGLVFQPQAQREMAIQAQLNAANVRQLTLQAEISAVKRTSGEMRAQQQADFLALKQKYATLQAIAKSSSADAPRIADLVNDVLHTQHPRVTLENLKTLPVKRLNTAASTTDKKTDKREESGIYRYGVELELRGSYLDLLAYLKSLEDSGNALFWSNVNLSAGQYPDSRLRVTVYMLSSKPNLGVS